MGYYISNLIWSRFVVEPVELSEFAESREVLQELLWLLTRDPPQWKSGYENE